MKKPILLLDMEKKVDDLTTKSLSKKRSEVLFYCIEKRGYKNPDTKNLSTKYEKVQNYSIEILTFRYNGELLFREFPTGRTTHLINKRYELADDLK